MKINFFDRRLYSEHSQKAEKYITNLNDKGILNGELFPHQVNLDIIFEENLLQKIVSEFFSIYQRVDYEYRKNMIEITAKFFIKLKRVQFFNLILVYTQFIESLEKEIKNEYSEEKEYCEFEESNDIFYETICKFDKIHKLSMFGLNDCLDFSNYLKIKLKFFSTNQIKNDYLISFLPRVLCLYIESDYHNYKLNKKGDTLSIRQNNFRLIYKEFHFKHIYSKNLSNSNLIFLERDLEFHFKTVKRNTSNFKKAYEQLNKIILENFKDGEILHILPFGSITQFSYNIVSDLEITIFSSEKIDDLDDLIDSIEKLLYKKSEYDNIDIRRTKRTKLINFNDKIFNVKIELMLNNYFGVLNSELIRMYCLYDSRCAIIINIIKDWSKLKNINGNFNNYLSSYCFTLLVIYFLQKIDPPILPVFSDRNIKDYSDIKCNNQHYFINLKFISNTIQMNKYNDLSISELLLKFFIFYSHLFNEMDYCIDITDLDYVYRFNEILYLNKSNMNKRGLFVYCFIDPIDCTYNPGQYFSKGTSQETNYRDEMRIAIKNILSNKSIFE
jgi:DNA polymerase sigma